MIIQQLDGLSRARRGKYLPDYRDAKKLRDQMPEAQLVWIPRRNNKEADKLSRQPINLFVAGGSISQKLVDDTNAFAQIFRVVTLSGKTFILRLLK